MKAKHVNLSYEISEFDDLNEFLEFTDEEKVQYIIEHTEYIKNYIIESIKTDVESTMDEKTILSMSVGELFSDATTSDLAKNAKEFLLEGISLRSREEIEVYITPYIDTVDIPAFIIYNNRTYPMPNKEWLIYINDDALDVYIEQHFLQGVSDLSKPNKLTEITEENIEAPSFNIGYLQEQLLGGSDDVINTKTLDKLEMIKKTMGFLLFKGEGLEMHNDMANKEIVMFDNLTAEDFVFVYKMGSEWHVYGNNKSNSAFKSNHLKHVIDWLGSNHQKNKSILSHNPNYNSNLKKVKKSLYNQRLKYLSDMRNRRRGASNKGSENKKPVVQLDRYSGYSIQTWPSASDASKSLGISRTSITKVANGVGASAGGFGWKFA